MNPALILIDLQNDYFKDGRLKKHKSKLIKNINNLTNNLRGKMLIIWVRQEFKPDLSDAPLFNKLNNIKAVIKGTPGAKFLTGLDINENDIIITKKRFSSFFKTKLENVLKKNKIDTLIIGGINTMSCVRTTAIDAYMRDYNVIIAKECVDAHDKEQHDNSLKYLSYSVAKIKNNQGIIKALNN